MASPVSKHGTSLILVTNCILLSAFVSWSIDCQKMNSMCNIKIKKIVFSYNIDIEKTLFFLLKNVRFFFV